MSSILASCCFPILGLRCGWGSQPPSDHTAPAISQTAALSPASRTLCRSPLHLPALTTGSVAESRDRLVTIQPREAVRSYLSPCPNSEVCTPARPDSSRFRMRSRPQHPRTAVHLLVLRGSARDRLLLGVSLGQTRPPACSLSTPCSPLPLVSSPRSPVYPRGQGMCPVSLSGLCVV